MPRRRVKQTVKQRASSRGSNINSVIGKKPQIEKQEGKSIDQDVESQSAAIRAVRDREIAHLLTGLHLLRSYFNKEHVKSPVLQFFKEHLPNLSLTKDIKTGKFELEWKGRDGNLLVNRDNDEDIHAAVLRHMSIAFPNCSAALPSFGGCESSGKSVKSRILLSAGNLPIRNFVLEEPSDTQMLGLQDSFQTPEVSSRRFSVGITPKTLRLPRNGEMLLSIHGSPLGVFKEENVESIQESEKG